MKHSERREPNFFIGGSLAGGTSFLSSVLTQHPQVYLPKITRPEPQFFNKSWEYEKGLNYYLERWFFEVPETAVAVGERSSSYLHGGASVARRIAEAYPHMKFIFTLRNPIERAWANYRFTVLEGLEELDFEEALEREQERMASEEGRWAEIQPRSYTRRGYYGAQLKEYCDSFDREAILVIKSESLSKNTQAELLKIYAFLGLSDVRFTPERVPDHTSFSVVDRRLQTRLRAHFGDDYYKIVEAIRKEQDLSVFVRNDADESAVEALRNNLKGTKEPMPQECRNYLRKLYADDMKLLEQFVDFDISDWK